LARFFGATFRGAISHLLVIGLVVLYERVRPRPARRTSPTCAGATRAKPCTSPIESGRPRGEERGDAFDRYVTALDREQHAAHGYRHVVEQTSA
jgi:hypothetical protein